MEENVKLNVQSELETRQIFARIGEAALSALMWPGIKMAQRSLDYSLQSLNPEEWQFNIHNGYFIRKQNSR